MNRTPRTQRHERREIYLTNQNTTTPNLNPLSENHLLPYCTH